MSNLLKPPAGLKKQDDQVSTKPRDMKAFGQSAAGGGIEMPADLLSEFGLTVWEADIDADLDSEDERRRFQRVNRGVFLDQEIAIFTNNLTKSVPSQDLLLDISASGLLLVSDREKDTGDILLLEFRMGSEKFKLKGEVKRKKERTYGVQFLNPPPEIVERLERLYGSVILNKAQRGQHRTER